MARDLSIFYSSYILSWVVIVALNCILDVLVFNMRYRLVGLISKPSEDEDSAFGMLVRLYGRGNLKVVDLREVSVDELCGMVYVEDLPFAIRAKVAVDKTGVEKYLVLIPCRNTSSR